MEILNEKEIKEENQEKLLSSIRDLAGSFTASSRELRDQVAAISENVEIMRSSQRSDSDLNFDCILVSGSSDADLKRVLLAYQMASKLGARFIQLPMARVIDREI